MSFQTIMFRFFYIVQSYCPLVIFYLINQGVTVDCLLGRLPVIEKYITRYPCISVCLSYMIYISIALLTAGCVLWWVSKRKGNDEILYENIKQIYPANDYLLPTFSAYIFIGLSVDDPMVLALIYLSLCFISKYCELYIYNPLFYVFGYRFYYIETNSGMKLLLMSKYKRQLRQEKDFPRVKRINDFCFIDLDTK